MRIVTFEKIKGFNDATYRFSVVDIYTLGRGDLFKSFLDDAFSKNLYMEKFSYEWN